ncbi:Serine/threonine-protein phosphatase 2A activator [Dictyocoela muelleri]|nr:Serine/threonine-protein phosphatase 2A activator [Dictyocoela muelleri]
MKNSFTSTDACRKIKEFVKTIDLSIQNETQTTNKSVSDILKLIKNKASEIHLSSSPQRYGNRTFRHLITFIETFSLGTAQKYLNVSFGNPSRIDYGTGHELSFLCFIFCMREMGKIKNNEVFPALCEYFDVIRFIISKFNLEPAGSHGPWGLDDYQILPFLFGSSEIVRDREKFSQYDDKKLFEELLNGSLGDNYEYGRTLKFVESQKCKFNDSSFEKHSPFIWELQKQPWNHINNGLFKLFVDDVLEKPVVTQHFIYTEYLNDSVNN